MFRPRLPQCPLWLKGLFTRGRFSDLFTLCGVVLIVMGIAQIYRPAATIAAGLACIAIAVSLLTGPKTSG